MDYMIQEVERSTKGLLLRLSGKMVQQSASVVTFTISDNMTDKIFIIYP